MSIRLTYATAQLGAALPRPVVPLPFGVGAEAEPVLAGFINNNWRARVQVTTNWQSDISRSFYTDAQARRQLTDRPTRSIDVELAGLDKGEVYVLNNIVQRLSSSRVPGPIYSDAVTVTSVQQVPATNRWLVFGDFKNRRFYIGQRIVVSQAPSKRFSSPENFLGEQLYCIVRGVSYNAILIQDTDFTPTSVGSQIIPGNKIFPLMDCRIVLNHRGTALTDRASTFNISLLEASGPMTLPGSWEGDPSALFPVAGGSVDFAYAPDAKPVYNPQLNWFDGVPKEYVRQGEERDSGKAGITKARGFRPSPVWELPLCGDRSFMWRQLQFFDWARGRSNSFWFVDFEAPWDIRKNTSGESIGWGASGTTSIAPTSVQIDRTDSLTALRDFYTHIAVAFTGQSQPFAIRPIESVQTSTNSYQLNWSNPLIDTLWGLFTDQGQVRIYPCRLVNYGDDSFVETWETDDFCVADVQLTGVEEERNVSVLTINPDSQPSPIPEDAHFSFAAGDNNYDLDRDGNLVRAGAWPSFFHKPRYIFDSREDLPKTMPLENAPRISLRNLTGDPAVFTYRQDRSNGQRPTIQDPSHGYLPHFDFGEDITKEESRIWGVNDWTFMVCLTPAMQLNDYSNPTMEIRDGSGNAIFQWWFAQGSAAGNSLVRFYDTPGVINPSFELLRPSMVQSQPVVALIRYTRANTFVTYKITNATVASINTAPAQLIQYDTVDTNPWFAPLDFGTGPSTAREANFGDEMGLNAILNVRRAMTEAEINAVGEMWARTYGFSWAAITL